MGAWNNVFAALLEHKLAIAAAINERINALGANFDKLPLPRDDGKLGFDGPCSVGDATDDTHATNVKGVREGVFKFGVDTGVANAYVVTLGVSASAYAAGMEISFVANNGNTGASTVNVNGLGNVDIKIDSDRDLISGYINTGDIVELYHNGTNFQITSLATKLVQDSAADATQAAIDTGIDLGLTNADVVLTHADVVLTHADVVLTHADVVLTHADVATSGINKDLSLQYAIGDPSEPAGGSSKYWAGVASSGETGLEAIDEGNGVGWRLVGRDPNTRCDIGFNAIDFSQTSFAGNMGARGDYSCAGGTDIIVGDYSFSWGLRIDIDRYSAAFGTYITGSVQRAFGMGDHLLLDAQEALFIGRYNVGGDFSSLFEIGMGSSSATKNAFKVTALGDIFMPEIPTSDPGIVGALWNDSGTLKISI